jgi:septal ring factor EnvC (AmiA/AmiB activator)
MTGEEMERAIEFLVKSQASFEARQAAYESRLADISTRQDRTDAQIQALADTQSRFIEATTQSITALAEAQSRTDDRLNRLITLFEQHITVGH